MIISMKKTSIPTLLSLALLMTMTACSESGGITATSDFPVGEPKAEDFGKSATISDINKSVPQSKPVKDTDTAQVEKFDIALFEEQPEFPDEYDGIIFNADGSVFEYIHETDGENSGRKNGKATLDGYLGYNDLKKLSREERVEYFRTAGSYDFRLFVYPDEIMPDMCLPLDEQYLPDGWEFNFSKLYADEGSDVYSTAAGTVTYANEYGSFSAYGNTVVIEHENGYASMYSGLKDIYVKTGQQVESGEAIANLADHTIRKDDTPYLTFEIYKDNEPLTMPGDGVIGIKELYYCLDAIKKDISDGADNVRLCDYDNIITTN